MAHKATKQLFRLEVIRLKDDLQCCLDIGITEKFNKVMCERIPSHRGVRAPSATGSPLLGDYTLTLNTGSIK